MKKLGYTPNAGLYLAQIPESYYESKGDLIINESTKEAMRKKYIETGDLLEIVAVGEGCRFARVGQKIMISTRGMETLTIDDRKEPLFVVRESDIKVKQD